MTLQARRRRPRLARQAVVLIALVLCQACAGAGRAERIAKLSPEASQQFQRYRQFMTDRQIGDYLDKLTDTERQQIIDGLKVDEMLSQFEPPVRDAIWAQTIMIGMNRAAVLLSWGGPYQRDVDFERGNEIERWTYKRDQRTAQVTFMNGLVSDWDDGVKK